MAKPSVASVKRKINEALKVLKALGLPREQQNERSALTLLALLGLRGYTVARIHKPDDGHYAHDGLFR